MRPTRGGAALVAIILLGLPLSLHATERCARQPRLHQRQDVATIQRLEHAWTAAFLEGDTDLERCLLTPDFREIMRTGEIKVLADELALAEKNKGKHLAAPDPANGIVLLHGNVAVAYGTSRSTGAGGHPRRMLYADYYVWENGAWHVFFAQQTLGHDEAIVPVGVGRAVVALAGPWAFHTGDNPQWADPSFDDSSWESVGLAAPPNAHDSDIGLTGYISGWTARGHAGYSGYAWYRMRVMLTVAASDSLALSGPSDVDDAYQIFVNGVLLGGSGRFSGATPVVYAPQPRMFPLRIRRFSLGTRNVDSSSAVIAVRVWVSPSTISGAPRDAGGIHIAPAIGEANAIHARYRLQWLEIFNGFVVEVALPLSFLLLAIMACTLYVADLRDPAYLWLSVALIATGLVRANQAFFFWTQIESANVFGVVKEVILVPLVLGTWMMAWYYWFRPRTPAKLPSIVGALTVVFALSQVLGTPYSTPLVPPSISAVFQSAATGLHLCFAALMTVIVYQGSRQHGWDSLTVLTATLLAIALFAYELSVLHVPGIWFPFGVGVSRAQFAYAGMDVALFALLLRRHRNALSSGRAGPASPPTRFARFDGAR